MIRGKIALMMILLLGLATVAIFHFSERALAQELPDLQLGGTVYICNNTTPLNGTAWEDTTNFAIWVNNSTMTPPFYKWTRYPATGWFITNKGKYAAVLPVEDKEQNWSNGAEYRIEIDGSQWAHKITNATSNGSGSFVTSGGMLPNDGDPEFTNFGSISNFLAYWVWGDPGDPQTDDFQRWDVITNCVDLRPTNITIDDGINPIHGPFDASTPVFPNPIGTFNVTTGQPVTLRSNVTNVFDSFVNRTTTIAFWNETPAGSGNLDWLTLGATPSVQPLGTVEPSPNTAIWPGSSVPGIYDLYITVDFPGNFTEYNTSYGFPPNYGNVTELDDTDKNLPGLQFLFPENTNNTVKVRIIIEGPDLIPGDASSPDGIFFDSIQVPDSDSVSPSDTIIVDPGTIHSVSTNVTNLGLDTGNTFNITFFQSDNSTGMCEGDLFLGASQVLGGLAAGQTIGPLPAMPISWAAPFIPGRVWINITVDNNSQVQEAIETNNYYCIQLIVSGPDLIPGDPTSPDGIFFQGLQVQDTDGTSPSDRISIGMSTTYTISSNVSNIGSSTIQSFNLTFYQSDNSTGTCEGDIFLDSLRILGGLTSGATTGPFSIQWTSPSTPGDVWINISVDNNTEVQEMNEVNNYYCIHLDVFGMSDLIPYNGYNILTNSAQYIPSLAGNISINLVTGQVINIASVVKNVGNATQNESYTYYIYMNQTSSTQPDTTNPLYSNVLLPPLDPLEESEQQSIVWMAYMVPGTYYMFLHVEPGPHGESNLLNNTLILELKVFELPPPPSPILDADDESGDITITWTNVSDEEIVRYNIYWAGAPEELNFSGSEANATAAGSQMSYRHQNGIDEAQELCYVVRSVDIRGWEGPSSDVICKFTTEIPAGYSTFSLPLEPFDTKNVSWYLEDMALNLTDAIFSFNESSQRWIPHPRFLPEGIADFILTMGETYMMYSREGTSKYTFVGRPGTSIRYNGGVDNPGTHLDDWRIGAEPEFRASLNVVTEGDNIALVWDWKDTWNVSAYESLGGFNIYRASSRTVFNFSSPYARITGFSPAWLDDNATGDEYYYILVPVNTYGREGSSTLAICVKRVTYNQGYGDHALYLKPLDSQTTGDLLEGFDLTGEEILSAIYYFDSTVQRWIPHPAFIPEGIIEREVALGDGNLIYLLRSEQLTYVGR